MRVPEFLSRSLEGTPKPDSYEEALTLFCRPIRSPLQKREIEIAAQAEKFSVDFNDVRIAGYRWGGPPYVLALHGWCGRALQLSGLIAPLAERGFGLIAIDHPGHGESEGDQCTALMVAAIIPMVINLFPDTKHCAGHSFGAIGACLAMSEGWRVHRAVFFGGMTNVPLRFEEFAAAVGYDTHQTAEFLDYCESHFGRGKLSSISPTSLGPKLNALAALFHDDQDHEVDILQAHQLATTWKSSVVHPTTGLGHYRIIRDRKVLQLAAEFLTEPNDPATALDDAAQ